MIIDGAVAPKKNSLEMGNDTSIGGALESHLPLYRQLGQVHVR